MLQHEPKHAVLGEGNLTEYHISHDRIKSQIGRSVETESQFVVTCVWGQGEREEPLLVGTRFF